MDDISCHVRVALIARLIYVNATGPAVQRKKHNFTSNICISYPYKSRLVVQRIAIYNPGNEAFSYPCLAPYQMGKIAGCACTGNAGNVSPPPITLDLFNDDTHPSGHISRPSHVNVSQSCFHSLIKLLKPVYIVQVWGLVKINNLHQIEGDSMSNCIECLTVLNR